MIIHLKHFLRLPAEQPRPPTPQGQRTLLSGGRAKIDLKFMLSLPKALERVAWGATLRGRVEICQIQFEIHATSTQSFGKSGMGSHLTWTSRAFTK